VIRVAINQGLLQWARERAGLTLDDLRPRFPKLDRWERGEENPTLKQVERFAKATYAPIGYLFLPEPPVEHLPLPDLRTIRNERIDRPSPDLLEMVYVCQQRQAWYHDYARSSGLETRPFVGSVALGDPIENVAEQMRQALGFDLDARRESPTWTDALRQFIGQADAMGVLVMCSGVVMNNNRRRLDPDEFRGFAMVDTLAPLVFINGADTKAAQMFTLGHELAHIWLGQSAGPENEPDNDVEIWCNRVAAELLVPLHILRAELRDAPLDAEVSRLTRRFKVSSLVILRRLLDVGRLSRAEMREAYDASWNGCALCQREAAGIFTSLRRLG
jgi:Zn-dependent peptidase ImmA (M78 family)/transcriptional regulator with XRE-family HTH domain